MLKLITCKQALRLLNSIRNKKKRFVKTFCSDQIKQRRMAKSERKIKPFSNINTNDLKYSFVQNLKEKREREKNIC